MDLIHNFKSIKFIIIFFINIIFKKLESMKLKENKKDNSLNEIVKLSLKERKEIVKNKLNQPNITKEDLNDLLNYDNTNEDLIFKYLNNFNQLEYTLIQKYICVLSLKNIED